MRCLIIISAAAILSAMNVSVRAAEHGPPGVRRPVVNVPHVEPHRPAVYAPRVVIAYNPWFTRYGLGYYNYGYPYGYGYNYPSGYSYDSGYGYPYGYGAEYPYSYGYGYGYPYSYGYRYVPPIAIPADTLYGPGPIKRMLGVDNGGVPQVAARVVVPPAPPVQPPAPAAKDSPIGAAVKADGAAAAMARKFVDLGDAQFAAGKYLAANERYRRATATAPKAAEAFFHQAFAFVALDQYDLAVKAMKRGLSVDPAWPASRFRLNELYGGDDAAKRSHLDALAQAAEDDPQNGNLLFLVGVYLYFDGQAERAKPFFARAAQLTPGDHAHIDAFMSVK